MTYQSETDAPIERISWWTKPGMSLHTIAEALGKINKRTQILPPEAFYTSQADPEIRAAVETLRSKTTELTLFKTERGDCKFYLLLLGRTNPNQVIGLRTTSVET